MNITFFTHVRPFDDVFGPIQMAALSSWAYAYDEVQIVCFGPDTEHYNVIRELGYIPAICETNEYHQSDFGSMFRGVERDYNSSYYCEVSSDIILSHFGFLMPQLRHWEAPFVIGQRLDYDPQTQVYTPHPPSAVDWFLYRKGQLPAIDIPPFSIGRTAYDNWMVWAARYRWKLQVLDATSIVMAIHHNHPHPEHGNKAAMHQSRERTRNLELARATGCDRWCGIETAEVKLGVNP